MSYYQVILRFMKKFILTSISLILLIILPVKVLADYEATPQAKVKVDHLPGLFEKINEKIGLLFKFSNDEKFSYQQQVLERRMGELEYVVNDGQGDLIEEVSSRYGTYLGNFSDFAINNKMKNQKESLTNMYDEHLKLLTYFQQRVGTGTGWWILLQHNINLANQYKSQVQAL